MDSSDRNLSLLQERSQVKTSTKAIAIQEHIIPATAIALGISMTKCCGDHNLSLLQERSQIKKILRNTVIALKI
jgi:hypothetical protein